MGSEAIVLSPDRVRKADIIGEEFIRHQKVRMFEFDGQVPQMILLNNLQVAGGDDREEFD
jgi:hypothetical protein